MGGDGHDGAGAVAYQHIIRDPHGDAGAVDGVDGAAACENPGLAFGEIGALKIALAGGLCHVGVYCFALLAGGDHRHQRVLGREDHVGGAKERVGAGGVDFEVVVVALDREDDVGAGGAADPVFLHLEGAVGPVDLVEIFKESVGVFGDLQDPLAHGAPHNRVPTALALAVDDLLVGEDGAKLRAPVDGLLALVGQAFFVELEKNPLGPFVVVDVGGSDLPVPVDGEAKGLQLTAKGLDVVGGGLRRMSAGLQGILLGGQSKGVKAHGVQDVEAPRPLVARHDVGGGVALGVAHVQPRPGGVGEHVEDVVFRLLAEIHGLKRVVFLPVLLPFGFEVPKRRAAPLIGCFVAHSAPVSRREWEGQRRGRVFPGGTAGEDFRPARYYLRRGGVRGWQKGGGFA